MARMSGEELLQWAQGIVNYGERLESLLAPKEGDSRPPSETDKKRIYGYKEKITYFTRILGISPADAATKTPEELRGIMDRRAIAQSLAHGRHRAALSATTGRPPSFARKRRKPVPGLFR